MTDPAVRACSQEGKPGFQGRLPDGSEGPCRIYDPDLPGARASALAAALKDCEPVDG